MRILDRYSSLYPQNGDILTCPMCGGEFKVTDETRFKRKGEYVCDWNCFMGYPPTKKKLTQISASDEVKKSKSNKNSAKKAKEQQSKLLSSGEVDLFG